MSLARPENPEASPSRRAPPRRTARVLLALAAVPAPAAWPEPAEAKGLPPFKLGINTQIVATGFEVFPIQDQGQKLRYRPAESNYAGVILGYRWLGGTISFAVPAKPETREVEGVSQYRDYRISLYYRSWGLEAGYSRYLGYLIDNSDALSAAARGTSQYYKVGDLETLGYGISAFYVFSPQKFSLPALTDQSDIQKGSAGSWLALVTARQQFISSSTAILPTERQAAAGNEGTFRAATSRNLAAGVGYAYNWVPGAFFLGGLAGITLGYQEIALDLASGDSSRKGSASGNIHVRVALGLNAEHYFLTLSAFFDRYTVQSHNLEFGPQVQGSVFAGGVRF